MPPRKRDTLPKSHRRVAGEAVNSSINPKRISRREKEEKQRRMLYWSIGIAAALVVLILSAAALNEYFVKPRHVLATVDGTDIRRRDYWKFRAVELADQASQYAAIANSQFVDANQAQQYVQLAQQSSAEVDKVWGSTDLNESTLQTMIDDQVYLQSLDEFGIILTDQDVQDYLDQKFQPAEAPIFTPTPSPTLIPERAAWVTQTAVALNPPVEELVTLAGSPVGGSPVVGSPVAGNAAPPADTTVAAVAASSMAATDASPVAASTDGTPLASTPVAGSPEATPVMEVTPTPNQDQARQTATANFDDYQEAIFDRAHISRSEYVRLVVKPSLAREKINQQLTKDVGQSAEQVHASHILVDTKDLADALYLQLTTEGADFGQIAIEQSIDSSTAPNGGDLGWFTKGQMVDAFEEVAFTTRPGQVSQPVQTEFGWHIIKVLQHDPNRAMTDEQISQVTGAITSDWLTGRKSEVKIDSEIKPTPTSAAPENFVAPPDAPPTPTPTIEAIVPPVEVASPVASPVGGAETPVASTTASPASS